ncbi:MAG: phosphate ABC transporter substrate-binding protein [Myxococcales bacterium]|nr:phosphate ABC transporter substrate-binding protein [Myxococcales bacterium]
MLINRRRALALAALASCSGRYPGGPTRSSNASSILLSGSDTMVLLARRWAEAFARETRCVVQVSGGGSGTGIAALLNGTADLAMSSRPMHERERRALAARGRTAREHVVAVDAVAVYACADARLSTITLAQLAALYRGQLERWTTLDGRSNRVVLYGRESSSGTYAFFKERVLAGRDFAPEIQSLPGTASVIDAVARDQTSLGYAGLSTSRHVRRIAVGATLTDACEPQSEHVASGRYPLARPLFLYPTASAPERVQQFVAWVQSDAGQRLAEQEGFLRAIARSA